MINEILSYFRLYPSDYEIQQFGAGLINHTFKVKGKDSTYILQQVNTDVFKSPEYITDNFTLIQTYLNKLYPDYLFAGAIPCLTGEFLFKSAKGKYYRLFHFIKGSHTINAVSNTKQAFEAARQFGRFTSLLKNFDPRILHYTLADFHNLSLRFKQFEAALQKANSERIYTASVEINEVYEHLNILQMYNLIISNREIPIRVIHHDTKISNVLFDELKNGLCVIDLDTVMPGYFLSDLGDMMRTYLSPANEEETDISKIHIRNNIFSAICSGYLSNMGDILTAVEKKYIIYSGELMIYMQAIRFLTDYLNNDIYYKPNYTVHNLNRAKNQFKLLKEYLARKEKFKEILLSRVDLSK